MLDEVPRGDQAVPTEATSTSTSDDVPFGHQIRHLSFLGLVPAKAHLLAIFARRTSALGRHVRLLGQFLHRAVLIAQRVDQLFLQRLLGQKRPVIDQPFDLGRRPLASLGNAIHHHLEDAVHDGTHRLARLRRHRRLRVTVPEVLVLAHVLDFHLDAELVESVFVISALGPQALEVKVVLVHHRNAICRRRYKVILRARRPQEGVHWFAALLKFHKRHANLFGFGPAHPRPTAFQQQAFDLAILGRAIQHLLDLDHRPGGLLLKPRDRNFLGWLFINCAFESQNEKRVARNLRRCFGCHSNQCKAEDHYRDTGKNKSAEDA